MLRVSTMLKRFGVATVGGFAVFATSALGGAAANAADTSPAAPAGSVTIDNGDWWNPYYGSTFDITGTAPAGSQVNLNFHRSGTKANDFSLVRTVTADSNGTWKRSITANADYRYFASVGSTTSQTVLFQPAPTIDGPVTRVVAKDKVYTLTGTAMPGHRVFLRFHRGDRPDADWSIVRSVVANKAGVWSRTVLASVNYDFAAISSADEMASYSAKAYHLTIQ